MNTKGTSVFGQMKELRRKLRLTQAQIAERVGLPQSHIAKIESGTVDVQIGTLKKIFDALESDLIIAPRPRKSRTAILRARAHRVARANALRVMGTMALEQQKPSPNPGRNQETLR